MEGKTDIRDISVEDLKKFCSKYKLPKFRATQITEWLWKKRVMSFDKITSLPKPMRDFFSEHFSINPVKLHRGERSTDGTIKYSLQLHDKLLVEGVLIPSKKRLTACVSSQVGCSLACEFCATGTMKLERNLTASEIYDQVFILNEELNDELMQNIAIEMNLPETAFILLRPNKNPYLRWFTPMFEIDLCGHATLATAYVLFNILNHKTSNIKVMNCHI